MQTLDGRLQSPTDFKNMYSPLTAFLNIRPTQPTLTSFAVQLIQKKLTQKRNAAVKPSSGLHTSVTTKSADKSISWDDIGLTTVADVTEVLKIHQPLTWHYPIQLTTPKSQKENQIRKYWPPEVVCSLRFQKFTQY
jgi:hypothetical protein